MPHRIQKAAVIGTAWALAGCAGSGATVTPDEPAAVEAVAMQTEAAPAAPISQLEAAFERAAEKVAPSVVSITSARAIDEEEIPAFLRPFAPSDGELEGIGSGVIVDQQGHILTNNHVVDGASSLLVRLDDGREFEAEVVGLDPKTDLAVIRIDAKELEPAVLGRSEDLQVGQWVMAAGSPFGLPRSVTAGIVSATGRGSMGIADYGDFIQTDAAVNQGNSGGPLIDLEGQVVGINTAIASSTGGSNGIGFAIPIDLARGVMEQLVAEGVVRRGWLGVVMGPLTPELAESFGYDSREGVIINDLEPTGPAAAAGDAAGDIVTAIDGEMVENMSTLRNAIAQSRPNQQVELSVFRNGGAKTVNVQLGVHPEDAAAVPRPSKVDEPESEPPVAPLGLSLEELTPRLQRALGVDRDKGAVVSSIERGSVAADADLRVGDVVIEVGERKIRSVGHAERLLAKADLDRGVRIRVQRGPYRHFTVLRR